MMIIDPLLKIGTPVYSPSDTGSGGAGGGVPSPTAAGETGGQAADATSEASAGAGADAGAPPATKDAGVKASDEKAADPQQSENTEGDGQGDDTAASPTEFKLDVAEGMQEYAPQFEAYTEAVNGFLSENPEATVTDALKWAADYQAQAVQKAAEAEASKLSAQVDEWNAALEKDPEIGGQNFEKNKAIALKAIEDLNDPDLKEFLAVTGYGSHPSLVRLALRAGKTNQESPVLGSTPGKAKKSITEAFYGNS